MRKRIVKIKDMVIPNYPNHAILKNTKPNCINPK